MTLFERSFYNQIGANHKLELIYAYIEENFRYISNSIDSELEAKNHFHHLNISIISNH